ncbi:GIY-YIG nuclease family protein [Pleurocapsales cyanobacterium LEGE 10410]|nr:GIY-YIG nuclease family protein [Pleurocapsales cyanobacterium LEGE 10410]
MYYVYIIKSEKDGWRYVGFTSDLKERLKDHKNGKVASTKNHRPFKLASFIAVENKEIALNLERYLKTGSGIAWMNKRLFSSSSPA